MFCIKHQFFNLLQLNKKIFFFQGWYIVTYALGIYHLNLFIAFLTPKIDPPMNFDGKYYREYYREVFKMDVFS